MTLALFTSLILGASLAHGDAIQDAFLLAGDALSPTQEFAIVNDRPVLGGQHVELWGIRCGNALHSDTVTERHVRALDNMVAHGINLIGVYVQGSNGGYPDAAAGLNGFDRHGQLKASVARRLEWLVREADTRGMVVMVGLISPRKDQEFEDDAAIRRGVEEVAHLLESRRLRNVFVDLVHEYSHGRIDKELLREPGGRAKKAKLAAWFHALAPDIEVGVCPYVKSPTEVTFPGMDIAMIQKDMVIPAHGFVVNVETQKQDSYENDGVFVPEAVEYIVDDCERFRAEPRAAMLFHAAFIQGIGNQSGTAPHPEMGGLGTGVGDRGVRVYYEWVRDHVGRWEYPVHVPVDTGSTVAVASGPTREFELQDGRPLLGGSPVKLWGMRCHNALLSEAVTERLIRNLDNYVAHGINALGLCMQGTNSGFPDKELGPNAFTMDGRLIPAYGRRLERIVRAADDRGMAVCLTLFTPRHDQDLRDEQAIRRAIEQTGCLLNEKGLRNVFVNLYHEFDHPLRADHEIFREPDGARKKALLAGWLRAAVPGIETGACPHHGSTTRTAYPGCEVLFFHERAPAPDGGFAVNIEPPDRDLAGNEGNFQRFHLRSFHREWASYLEHPEKAHFFRSPFVESVRGVLGTGPNYGIGGGGTSTSDRGLRPYFDWMGENVGPWGYPVHGER